MTPVNLPNYLSFRFTLTRSFCSQLIHKSVLLFYIFQISDNYEEINITPESIKQDHNSISAWAKYWKESQDWRAIAKRDRRLRHQSTGLEFLTHNQNKSSDVEN